METRGVWLVSNPTGIYAKQPVVLEQLCDLIAHARQDVIVHSPYAVLNNAMRDKLAQAASNVPVTLMVNAVGNGANVVAGSDYLYHRDSVLSTGVNLLEYEGGISYHGKAAAIDDNLSVIGSYNLDMRSTYIDTELMLVIRGEQVNARLRENMSALHGDCREVSAADGGHRLPLGKRLWMYGLGALLQPFRQLV